MEGHMKRCEALAGQPLDVDISVTAPANMCAKELRERPTTMCRIRKTATTLCSTSSGVATPRRMDRSSRTSDANQKTMRKERVLYRSRPRRLTVGPCANAVDKHPGAAHAHSLRSRKAPGLATSRHLLGVQQHFPVRVGLLEPRAHLLNILRMRRGKVSPEGFFGWREPDSLEVARMQGVRAPMSEEKHGHPRMGAWVWESLWGKKGCKMCHDKGTGKGKGARKDKHRFYIRCYHRFERGHSHTWSAKTQIMSEKQRDGSVGAK